MSNVTDMRRFAIKRNIDVDKKRIVRLLDRIQYQTKFSVMADTLMPLFNPEVMNVEEGETTWQCVDATIPWFDICANQRSKEHLAELNMYVNGEVGVSLKEVKEPLLPFFSLMYRIDFESTFEETEKREGDYQMSTRDELLALFNEGLRKLCSHDVHEVRLENMFAVYPIYVMGRLISSGWLVDKHIAVDEENGFISIEFYLRDQEICMYYNPRIIKEKLEHLTKELTK